MNTRVVGTACPALPQAWTSCGTVVAARSALGGGETFEGLSVSRQAGLDIDPTRLQDAEEPFDQPAKAVGFDGPNGIGEGGDRMTGEKAQEDALLANRRVDLAH